jgi:hypothetical protein
MKWPELPEDAVEVGSIHGVQWFTSETIPNDGHAYPVEEPPCQQRQ